MEIEDAWFLSNDMNNISVDTAQDLKKVKQKISVTSAQQPIERNLKPTFSFLRIAAMFIVLVGASLWWYGNNEVSQWSTTDAILAVTLADGSNVNLNKNSSLALSKGFNKNNRNVILKGEAFFDVKSDKTSPFEISTERTTITVLGTKFNVKETPTSCQVAVVSGKVKVSKSNATDPDSKLILVEDQIGIHDYATSNLNLKKLETQNFNNWSTNKIVFRSKPLGEIVEEIKILYNVELQIEKANLAACKVSMISNNSQIEAVLEKISLSLEANLVPIENNVYLLKNGVCQ